MTFWKGLVTSRGGGSLSEETKTQLQSLFKQSKNIPSSISEECSSNVNDSNSETWNLTNSIHDSDSESDDEAINRISDLSSNAIRVLTLENIGKITVDEYETITSDVAMRLFLILLFNAVPYWKYEQFL